MVRFMKSSAWIIGAVLTTVFITSAETQRQGNAFRTGLSRTGQCSSFARSRFRRRARPGANHKRLAQF